MKDTLLVLTLALTFSCPNSLQAVDGQPPNRTATQSTTPNKTEQDETGIPPAAAQSTVSAEQEVLALEERMEALQRSDSAERTALWADDLVYIGNDAGVHDKASLSRAVLAGEVKTESFQVTERKIRV
jgi:hypothetical protein